MAKRNVEAMVSGMGSFLTFITALVERVKEFGGSMEHIYRLTTVEGAQTLRQVAKIIAEAGMGMMNNILSINRSKPFNPATFIGKGWSIAEQDERSLALTEVDLSKVRLVSMLQGNETRITGEEKLARLKAANHTSLDANIFQTLWENKSLIPESWKEKTNGNTTYIFFDGTILRNPDGDRYVLCLWFSGGAWGWHCDWLVNDWCVGCPSVVLAS